MGIITEDRRAREEQAIEETREREISKEKNGRRQTGRNRAMDRL